MTPTIHITEHGRVWPADEVAALGDVFTTDAPIEAHRGLQLALEARGYRVLGIAGFSRWLRAEVEHDVSAVTGGLVTDELIRTLVSHHDAAIRSAANAVLGAGLHTSWGYLCEARARCAAAINARRGAL